MKTKVVLEEHRFQVIIDPGTGKKDCKDVGITDRPPKDDPTIITNIMAVVKNLNSHNRAILDKKLKFYKPGDVFIAELKFIRKDETPESPNPLDKAVDMGSDDDNLRPDKNNLLVD